MESPFNMIICGMTNSGKTVYLLNMLEKQFNKHFDYIILICITFSWNKTYQEWKYINDSDFFSIECDKDKVHKILHIVQEIFKGNNSLIILDDCTSSQDEIIEKRKNNKYSTLEINLRYPYEYKIINPQ